MIYNDGSTMTLYYYVLNAQGDVIALLNADGTLAASYNYGAWGNYSVHDDKGAKITKASFIGHINPLRYRGYYYDRETRLYYLQSRYYDFANCRFINADTFATTDANGFLSANMFAYCENNPIMRTDETGEFPLAAVIAGGLAGAAVSAGSYLATNPNATTKGLLLAAGVGAVTGALGGAVQQLKSVAAVGAGLISGLYTMYQTEGTLGEKIASGVVAGTITGLSTYGGVGLEITGGSGAYDKAANLIGNTILGLVNGTHVELSSVGAQHGARKIVKSASSHIRRYRAVRRQRAMYRGAFKGLFRSGFSLFRR